MINNKKGFTLVELLVVIAIIGLLASVILVSVNSARAKARDSRRMSDMKALQTAIELYKDGNSGNAPTTIEAFTPLVSSGYIASAPEDPGNNTYTYSNTSDDDTYSIEFTTEADSSLGSAGVFCATSAGITELTGAACSAQEK